MENDSDTPLGEKGLDFVLYLFWNFSSPDMTVDVTELGQLQIIPSCEMPDVGCVARSLQLCLTLCDPMDCSSPGSSVHGILQARILEWIVISSSRESSQSWDWTPFSYVSCIGRRVLYHQHHLEGFPGSSDSKDWLYSKYFHPFSIKNRTHNTEKHGWLCSET